MCQGYPDSTRGLKAKDTGQLWVRVPPFPQRAKSWSENAPRYVAVNKTYEEAVKIVRQFYLTGARAIWKAN